MLLTCLQGKWNSARVQLAVILTVCLLLFHPGSLLAQQPVEGGSATLTVYKKWIGAADEPDVKITLDCESGDYSGDLYINQGSPKSWEVGEIDPDGILCNVYEDVPDNFRPDIIDCQGLYLLPGSREECTLVNTKIVKHIEMFNRYGRIVMIGLFLLVGMLTMRRLT